MGKKKEEEKKDQICGLKLLDYLMDFIKDGKFNPTTAGYIQKIFDALMNVRGMDVKTFKMKKK